MEGWDTPAESARPLGLGRGAFHREALHVHPAVQAVAPSRLVMRIKL